MKKNNAGFNLIEIIVSVVVIGTLLGIASISLAKSKEKTRDTIRKADISQIGRLISLECYLPEQGGGTYDVAEIIDELLKKYPKQTAYLTGAMKDPNSNDEKTLYKYTVADDGKHCVLYTNLENPTEITTLPDFTQPTMGGKIGVFEAPTEGWNGSKKYYQMSR